MTSRLNYSFLFLILSAFLVVSCDNYTKLLKSNDTEKKKEKAQEYYNKGNYYKAQPLFEELISVYRLSANEDLEEIYYFYCYCFYGQEKYIVSAYNFENFVKYYPYSKYTEECQYMHAYSYYQLSPGPDLDQTYTYKAIDAMQLFINLYPESSRVTQAGELITKMRRKMEIKAYNGAYLYFKTGNYKAAAASFNHLIDAYPDTPEAENVNMMIVKSRFLLAKNSFPNLQVGRYGQVLEEYEKFNDRYPDSNYRKELRSIYVQTLEALKNLEKL